MTWRSPFRVRYVDAVRLDRGATKKTRKYRSKLLFGSRQFGWPLMALRTGMDLGPVRHVLSQMVVAGTMTVYPPFDPTRGKNEAVKKVES